MPNLRIISQLFSDIDINREDKKGQPERKREQSCTEVHRDTHGRRLRVLVHGVPEVRKSIQESREGS